MYAADSMILRNVVRQRSSIITTTTTYIRSLKVPRRRSSSSDNIAIDDENCYIKCMSSICWWYGNDINTNRYKYRYQSRSRPSQYQRRTISSYLTLSLSFVPKSLPYGSLSPTILRRGTSNTSTIAPTETLTDNATSTATRSRSGNNITATTYIRNNISKIKRKTLENNCHDLSLEDETQHLMKILEEENDFDNGRGPDDVGGGNCHHKQQQQRLENQEHHTSESRANNVSYLRPHPRPSQSTKHKMFLREGFRQKGKRILVSDRYCYELLEQWKCRVERTNNLQEARMAKNLLLRICRNWKKTRLEDTLNIQFYDLVLETLCLAANTNEDESGLVEADEFLCTNIPLKLLTAKSFHIVMNAYSKSGREIAGRKVQELYDRLEYLYLVNGSKQRRQKQKEQQQGMSLFRDDRLRPNQRTLTILLEAWANSGRSTEASERIITLFRTIMERNGYHQPHEKEVEKQRQRLEQTSLKNSKRSSAAIFFANNASVNEIIDEDQFDSSSAITTAFSGADNGDLILFNTLMRTLTKAFGNRWAAETCEQILELLIQTDYDDNNKNLRGGRQSLQADTQTYSIVLNAWAKCESIERGRGDAAQRAHDMLHRMILLYSQGSNVKPNVRSFTSCIAAWSRAGQPQQAENVLDELLEENDFLSHLDVAAWNAVLMAWSRSGRNASVETKRMLEKMRAFANPNIRSYNSLLHAYSQERDKMVEALSLLKWLEDESSISPSSEASLAPDIVSYNTVLNALARNRSLWAAEKSSQLLQSMEDKSSWNAASSGPVPDVVSYTNVIRAWGNSGITSPFDHVVEIFGRFLITDPKQVKKHKNRIPDRIILATVLQTLGKERKEKIEALEQIVQIFEIIDAYRVPLFDDSLFELAIDSVIQLTRDANMYNNRKNSVAAILKKCCSHGMVSRGLLDKLRRTLSHGEVDVIIGLSPYQNTQQDWTSPTRT